MVSITISILYHYLGGVPDHRGSGDLAILRSENEHITDVVRSIIDSTAVCDNVGTVWRVNRKHVRRSRNNP